MEAHAVVEAVTCGGRTSLTRLRSEPPLALRSTPGRLLLVGTAAGPLGGDRLRLDLRLGPGAELDIGSAAASMLLPRAGQSMMHVDVVIADGARLVWAPEPTISVAASDHVQRVLVRLDGSATLEWRDTVVVGRHREVAGELASSIRVERAGRVLCHHELGLGARAGSWSTASLAGVSMIESTLVVGAAARAMSEAADPQLGTAVLRVGDDAMVITRLHR